jgi:hypothetical protein
MAVALEVEVVASSLDRSAKGQASSLDYRHKNLLVLFHPPSISPDLLKFFQV